jgi:hypothetical protein
MELDTSPATEVILSQSARSLGNFNLDWVPQPGNYLHVAGQTYAVLERRHRYHLKAGRYQLHKVALYVQSAPPPDETSIVKGRLVVGDASCRFNARSEIIRCAVNPSGPCGHCRYFEPRSSHAKD